MTDPDAQEDEDIFDRNQSTIPMEDLPLVIEVAPGQADNGLLEKYNTDEYQDADLYDLVEDVVDERQSPLADASLEEKQMAKNIDEQLEGGNLLYEGQTVEAGDEPEDYATVETTRDGEDYLYVKLQAVQPQEGGRYGVDGTEESH